MFYFTFLAAASVCDTRLEASIHVFAAREGAFKLKKGNLDQLCEQVERIIAQHTKAIWARGITVETFSVSRQYHRHVRVR